jgi:hypothetical protein
MVVNGVLILWDFSAAFDTVDHAILLERLETSFGLISSQLVPVVSARSYSICWSRMAEIGCKPTRVQRSRRFGARLLGPHLHADDTQVYTVPVQRQPRW